MNIEESNGEENRDISSSFQNEDQFPLPGKVIRARPLKNCCTRVSNSINSSIGSFFYRVGVAVATHPAKVIVSCFLFTCLAAIGLIGLKTEKRVYRLFVPTHSNFMRTYEWKLKYFPEAYRTHIAVHLSENVLTKDVLLEELRFKEIIAETEVIVEDEVPSVNGSIVYTSPRLVTWEDKCIAIPTLTENFLRKRRKRNSFISEKRSKRSIFLDAISYLSRDAYCTLLEETSKKCLTISILDIWNCRRDVIESLTNEQIIEDINSQIRLLHSVDISDLLSGIENDESGKIIKATGLKSYFFTTINFDRIIPEKFVDLYLSGTEVDVDGFRWEQEATERLLKFKSRDNASSDFQFILSTNINEVLEDTLQRDTFYLIPIGYLCVFLYVQLFLGKLNFVEARPVLSICGITSALMSIVISGGLCNLCGVTNTVVNRALPFLLLALGIDDMFIIMQSFDNLSSEERKKDLPDQIGSALRHAGSSILVTSVTDMAAFFVGAMSSLPCLHSFFIYSAVGIIALFVLQVTFFVACLKFDQIRIRNNRNSVICCIKMSYWKDKNKGNSFLRNFFHNAYPKIFLNVYSKMLFLVMSFVMVFTFLWLAYNLEQKFNVYSSIPKNSYLHDFFKTAFPSFKNAESAHFYVGNISLYNNLDKIDYIVTKLERNTNINKVDSWYREFQSYSKTNGIQIPDPTMTEEDFQQELGNFLFSRRGVVYQTSFLFESPPTCIGPAPRVLASKIDYYYKFLTEKTTQMEVLSYVEDISANISDDTFTGSLSYINAGWEVDRVLTRELFTNISLASLVIFIITFALLSSLVQSVLVLSCVLMTIVNTAGLMHLWNIPLDAIACANLVICVGLSVDYSTHVALMFLSVQGTRDERVRQTMYNIGPAVLNGGVCTFLAFAFMGFSHTYIFLTFFKVFFGVVMFGLYHGLVFLPIVLSLIGPAPYQTDPSRSTEEASSTEAEKLNPDPERGDRVVVCDVNSETVRIENGVSSQDDVENEVRTL